jgi:hypothetical protein
MKMSADLDHLTEQELVLAADGELSPRRATEVQKHLSACRACRSRMAQLEMEISEVTRVYLTSYDQEIPPASAARALLKSRLAELAMQPAVSPWQRFVQIMFADRLVAALGLALLIVLVFGQVLSRIKSSHTAKSDLVESALGPTPDRRLTPGSTRKVSIGEICSMPREEVVRAVSAPVREEIFQEYGIINASAKDYEIDYLIAPGLGGADDIHNLWPEPYTTTKWDAHVKDGLEQRLHEMVCSGQVDLSTAQNEIAANWIAAYKKYFRSDEPRPYATP